MRFSRIRVVLKQLLLKLLRLQLLRLKLLWLKYLLLEQLLLEQLLLKQQWLKQQWLKQRWLKQRSLKQRSLKKLRLKPQWLMLAAAALIGLALVASGDWLRSGGGGLERLLISAMQGGVITGHSEDGTFYRLQVRQATLDKDKAHYHYLTEPRAVWSMARADEDKDETEEDPLALHLAAPVGELDSKTQLLFLPQAFEVRLASADKTAAEPLWVLRSARGTLSLRDTHLASDAPAHASNASTEIRSQFVEWEHAARRLIFRGDVESRWLPPDGADAAP